MRCGPLLALAVMCAWGTARASDPDHVERARALFNDARALLEAGNCPEAMAKLHESLRYNESVGARLALAECLKHERPLEAWRELKRAEVQAIRANDPRATYAREHAAALEAQVALVRLRVPAVDLASEALRVHFDSVPIERIFYETGLVAVEPGRHRIEAYIPGKGAFSETIDAREGSAVVVDVVFAEPPAPAPAPFAPDRGEIQRWTGLAVGGLGVVGVGVGAAFALVASSRLDEAKRACSATSYPRCDPGADTASAVNANDSARSAATVATVAFAAGGVALAAGAVLFLTAPRARTIRARLAPRIGGVEVVGVF
jgi:hypothetical protein